MDSATPGPDPLPSDLLGILERSRDLGFLGPGPVEDHVRHAERLRAVVQDLPLPAAARVVDLGSGGGVPGLVVASATPEWSWILLDAMERRTTFLSAAVRELGLAHVRVRRERAEEAGRSELRAAGDLVVARSFGAPAVTAECAAPLLRPGGFLVVSEPPEPSDERWPPDGLLELGLDPVPVATGSWIVFQQRNLCGDRYPRKVGQPAKRPLW